MVSIAYQRLCMALRFYSGPFYRMPTIQKYDYYWRLDSSNVEFHCDLHFDPFVYMQEHNIVYGLNVAIHETPETVPTLWDSTLRYRSTFRCKYDMVRYDRANTGLVFLF
jgi:alpha 1,2-mannosyltransferase